MNFAGVDSLRLAGFTGFESVDALRASRLANVPEEPGVYLVVRPAVSAPQFLGVNPAGRYKGHDPTEDPSQLQAAWVPSACVLYVGRAGGRGTKATLRSRLRAYLRQGLGYSAGHSGGRRIWQLADSGALLFAWRPEQEPHVVEGLLLKSCLAIHYVLPFANRRR